MQLSTRLSKTCCTKYNIGDPIWIPLIRCINFEWPRFMGYLYYLYWISYLQCFLIYLKVLYKFYFKQIKSYLHYATCRLEKCAKWTPLGPNALATHLPCMVTRLWELGPIALAMHWACMVVSFKSVGTRVGSTYPVKRFTSVCKAFNQWPYQISSAAKLQKTRQM